jgi:hypothetical protein
MAGRPKEGLGNGVRSASALPLPVAGKGKRAAKEGERSRDMRGGERLCHGAAKARDPGVTSSQYIDTPKHTRRQ